MCTQSPNSPSISTGRPTGWALQKSAPIRSTSPRPAIFWASFNVAVCGLRFFYGVTLGSTAMVERIPYARKRRQLPVILSAEEVARFFAAVPNLKHRTALMTAYAAGLRVSEVVRLKLADIARNVRVQPALHGWPSDRTNCCRCRISISSSHCRLQPPKSPSRTRQGSMPSCFKAVAETLSTIAADPRHLGAEIGFIAVLHTWGQNPAASSARSLSGPWRRLIAGRPTLDFLSARLLPAGAGAVAPVPPSVPGEAAGRLRCQQAGIFRRACSAGRRRCLHPMSRRTAAGRVGRLFQAALCRPAAVLAYLSRYTHRVAIANSRLVALAGGRVSFRWRDYRHHNKDQVMTLAADEFIRRFLLHALPEGSTASAITAFLPTADGPKNSRCAAHCSWSPMLLCRSVAAKSAGNSPITCLIFALVVADGWSRSTPSRTRDRRGLRLGTTAHDRCTFADDRHVGGPGRHGDSELLRREHLRCAASGAHVVLPPSAGRFHPQPAVRQVHQCRPPTYRTPGLPV